MPMETLEDRLVRLIVDYIVGVDKNIIQHSFREDVIAITKRYASYGHKSKEERGTMHGRSDDISKVLDKLLHRVEDEYKKGTIHDQLINGKTVTAREIHNKLVTAIRALKNWWRLYHSLTR